MKQFIFIAGISALSITGCTSNHSAATSVNISEIRGYAPDVDISSLSNAQIHMLLNIIHTGDREGR